MKQNSFIPTQKFQLKEDLITSKIGDEIVLMTIENGKYFSINQVGSLIWEEINQPTTAEDVCMKLVEKYAVSMEQCLSDTLPFLERLHKADLLVLIDEQA